MIGNTLREESRNNQQKQFSNNFHKMQNQEMGHQLGKKVEPRETDLEKNENYYYLRTIFYAEGDNPGKGREK